MQLTIPDVAYIITNILQTYTVALLFRALFNKELSSKAIGYISYLIYFTIISGLFLFINIPIINLIVNIIAFFIITLNYKVKMSKRIIVIVSVYSILVVMEVIVAFLFNNLNLAIYQTNPKEGLMMEIITVRILSYACAILIGKYKKNRQDSKIPISYWITLFFIPVGIIVIIMFVLQSHALSQFQVLVIGLILLGINVSVFYLYDELNVALVKQQEQALLKQQNNYYNQQFNLMQESIKKVRTIKHDLKNHLFVIQSFIQMNNCEKAMAYISKILENSNNYHEYIQSGNAVIDSILNYKLARAEERGIETHIDVVIPKDLNITPFSMSVILGNLLDNAMNATEKLEDNRRIDIGIKYKSNMLIIKVDNTFDGNVAYKQGKIVTTHDDRENHGLGLQSIRRVLEQHNGELNISHDKETFSATSLMYI